MSRGKVRAIYVSVHYEDNSEVSIGVKNPHDLSLDYYGDKLVLDTKGEFDLREKGAGILPTQLFNLTSLHEGMWIEVGDTSGFLEKVMPYYGESRFGDEYVSSIRLNIDGNSYYHQNNIKIKLRRKHDVT